MPETDEPDLIEDGDGNPLPKELQPGGPIYEALEMTTNQLAAGDEATSTIEDFVVAMAIGIAPVLRLVLPGDDGRFAMAMPAHVAEQLYHDLGLLSGNLVTGTLMTLRNALYDWMLNTERA